MRTPIRRWSARGVAVFCVAFALFQLALALGAPFGQVAWGGSSAVLPDTQRWASAAACAYLLLAAGLMEVRAGDWGRGLPAMPFLIFNILLAAQLFVNTIMNLSAQTEGEKMGMGAASAVGCGLCLLALKPVRRRRDH